MNANEKIKIMREAHHLSQEQMAEKLHLSTDAYAKIERGERGLDVSRLEKIASVFGIDASELLAINDKSSICFINENSSQYQYHYYHNDNIAHHLQLKNQIEKLELQLAHKDELLAQKDKEIALLRQLLDK